MNQKNIYLFRRRCELVAVSFLLFVTALQVLQAQNNDKFSKEERQLILFNNETGKIESVVAAEKQSMRVLQITDKNDSLMLRKNCADINVLDPLLKTLIARMTVTMMQNGGVGIAAPQVGILRNVFIFIRIDKMLEFAQMEQNRQKEYNLLREKIKRIIEKEETPAKERRNLEKTLRAQEKTERAEYRKLSKKIQAEVIEVVMNPKIIAYSDSTICFIGDGCLSIPNVQGNSLRHAWVDVEYYNRRGAKVFARLLGYNRNDDFTSVIFQHEYDHTQGILFIDKLCVE
jgi:peptide deformylase